MMKAPESTPTAPVDLSLPAELLLARLLIPAKRPPPLSAVQKSLKTLFRHPPSSEYWRETLSRLRSAGLIQPKTLQLTTAGQERALAFLGIAAGPPRITWKKLVNRFLIPKALGMAAEEDLTKRLSRYEDLAAILLKRRFRLKIGKTLPEVLTALVCRELGLSEVTDWSGLRRDVLSRLIESSQRLTEKQIASIFPRAKLDAQSGGVAGLRQALLIAWTFGSSDWLSDVPDNRPDLGAADRFDLAAFAKTVKSAARHCPTGRFGKNKVFINHLWKYLRNEPGLPKLDLPAFKNKLLEANATRLIVLSRADMAPDLAAADVEESATEYLNTVFHFVTLEEVNP